MTYPNAFPGWAQSVLAAIKAPITSANVSFLNAWHAFEGSNATNNPLNTTGYAPVPVTVGTGAINSAGVQNYPTQAQGIGATAAFLQMPNFTHILAALKSGNPNQYIANGVLNGNTQTLVGELGTWGSGSFASNIAASIHGPGGLSGFLNHYVGGPIDSAAGAVGGAISNGAGAVLQSVPGVAQGEAAYNAVTGLPGDIGKAVTGATSWLAYEVPLAGLYLLLTVAAFALIFLGVDRGTGGGAHRTIIETGKAAALGAA